MDHAGGLGGGVALVDGPGAGFLGACGEVGLQAEGVEAGAGEGVQAGFVLADGFEELGGFLLVEFEELGLGLGVEEDAVGGGDEFAEFLLAVLVSEDGLIGVEDVEEGLRGQQVEFAQRSEVDLVLGLEQGAVVLEDRLRLLDGVDLGGPGLVLAGLLLEARDGFLDGLEVGEDEFGLDDGHVADGVDASVDVDDVVVAEYADDLADRVGFADVGEELVAHALTLGRALDDAGDVDEGHGGGQDALGPEDLGETLQACVRQLDQTDVGLDGGERVVRRQNIVAGQCVEQG